MENSVVPNRIALATVLCLFCAQLQGVVGLQVNSHIRTRRSAAYETDPSLTSFSDSCPNGYIAYEKFNTTTGVFDCAIKTAEICHALCQMVDGPNWDVSNSVGLQDSEDRENWYCRSLPGYPTRNCYFKPRVRILADVAAMKLNRH